MRKISIDFNRLYRELFTTQARYIDLWGGRARGGSHTGTAYFLFLLTRPSYFRGCFLRAVLGDVRGSLWQDLKDRIEESGIPEDEFHINESLMTITYLPTGNSIISKGFKKSSGSQSAKLKSLAGMTHVLIEECEEVDEEDFNKLDDSLRTSKVDNIQILRLFNPPGKNHWLIKRFYNVEPSGHEGWYRAVPKAIPGFLSIHSTYIDNKKNLNESTIRKYQAYGDPESPGYNPDFYYRDVLGLVSEGKKGRIITRAYPITLEHFRSLPYPSFYGLDFGYSTDPVALTELKYHNGRGYAHQVIYQPGLTDDDLVALMLARGVDRRTIIRADSAEPKSIETIRRKGFNIKPARKGPDSIKNGIKLLQGMDLFVTETSTDTWTEIEEYSWELDTQKNPTDTPIDKFNHAIDSMRYGFDQYVQVGKSSFKIANPNHEFHDLDWL